MNLPGDRCGFAVLDAKGRAKLCGKPPTCERMIDGIPFPACDACAAKHDAKHRPARLDFTDPAAVRVWAVDLRVAVDDAAGVTEDMLRRGRSRSLGHAEHRRLYREAKKKIAQLLDFADPPGGAEPEGEPRDPSGCGGAGPTH